ncbi:MAG: hypothetical protein ACQEP8_00415 [Chlamydiota bacterium]
MTVSPLPENIIPDNAIPPSNRDYTYELNFWKLYRSYYPQGSAEHFEGLVQDFTAQNSNFDINTPQSWANEGFQAEFLSFVSQQYWADDTSINDYTIQGFLQDQEAGYLSKVNGQIEGSMRTLKGNLTRYQEISTNLNNILDTFMNRDTPTASLTGDKDLKPQLTEQSSLHLDSATEFSTSKADKIIRFLYDSGDDPTPYIVVLKQHIAELPANSELSNLLTNIKDNLDSQKLTEAEYDALKSGTLTSSQQTAINDKLDNVIKSTTIGSELRSAITSTQDIGEQKFAELKRTMVVFEEFYKSGNQTIMTIDNSISNIIRRISG